MYSLRIPIEQGYIELLVSPRHNYMLILVLLEENGISQWCMAKNHMITIQLERLTLVWQPESSIDIFSLVWLRDTSSICHQSKGDMNIRFLKWLKKGP